MTTTHRCLDLLEQLRTKNDFIKYEVRLSKNPSKTSTISQSVQAKVMDHSHHRAFVTNYLNKMCTPTAIMFPSLSSIISLGSGTIQRCPLLALLFSTVLEAQPRTLRQEKQKSPKLEGRKKKEVKLSLFARHDAICRKP